MITNGSRDPWILMIIGRFKDQGIHRILMTTGASRDQGIKGSRDPGIHRILVIIGRFKGSRRS
jgi:hypothetical protein